MLRRFIDSNGLALSIETIPGRVVAPGAKLNTEHPAARELGLARNSLDINPTDGRFEPFRGSGARNEDWFAWGRPLYAPGDGTVVGAVDIDTGDLLETR